MARLEKVDYSVDNGKMIATEIYEDGSTRRVSIRNGITDYILNGNQKDGENA